MAKKATQKSESEMLPPKLARPVLAEPFKALDPDPICDAVYTRMSAAGPSSSDRLMVGLQGQYQALRALLEAGKSPAQLVALLEEFESRRGVFMQRVFL